MFGGDEVVKAKNGGGSATLSMAYAGAIFADLVIRAMNGESGLSACTYVESSVNSGTTFFSSRVDLGKDGIAKIHPVGKLDAFEQTKLQELQKELADSIKKGVEFAASYKL